MSRPSTTQFMISVLLLLTFWASQSFLIVWTATVSTESIPNDTQKGFKFWKKGYSTTRKDLTLLKWVALQESRLQKWNGNDTKKSSSLRKRNGDDGGLRVVKRDNKYMKEDLSLTNLNFDHMQEGEMLGKDDLPMLATFGIHKGEGSLRFTRNSGRILSTTYTKKSVGGWWPRTGIKEEDINFNVSCTLCNNTSNGKSNKKTKNLLSRLYQKMFVMTHTRLHPMHHRPVRVIIVDQRGHGDSRTVQGAIDKVRLDNKWRIQIIIRPGIYREKVYVPYRKPFITFQGSGNAITVITWNARAGDRNQGGEILGTFGSASVAIDSDYFVARDITFQNTSPPPLPGAQGMQAVALRISGDKAAFIDCRMLGAQDTLFDHVGRHFFLRCYIEGAIDFIFGDGRSLYLNCELHANAVSYGAVAASQRNSFNDNTGFSFVQCKITGSGLLYLGRAWGQYARILFAFCYFENIIIPDGWYDWGDTSRRETVFFGEYKCWGPGAQPRWRVLWSRQLSYQEARPFLSLGFINGHKWLNILT